MLEIKIWTYYRLVFGGIRIAACLLWVGLGAGPAEAQGAQDEDTQNGAPAGEAPVFGDSIELKSASRETQDSASELAPVEVEHHLSSVLNGDVEDTFEFLEEKALANQNSEPIPVSFRLGGCVGIDPSCFAWAPQAELVVARAGLSVSARPGINSAFIAGELKIALREPRITRAGVSEVRTYIYGGVGRAYAHVKESRNPRGSFDPESRPPKVEVDEWVIDRQRMGAGFGMEFHHDRLAGRVQVGGMTFYGYPFLSFSSSFFWDVGSR